MWLAGYLFGGLWSSDRLLVVILAFLVFLGVPAGTFLVLLMGIGRPRTPSRTTRLYFRTSYALLVLGWISVLPTAAIFLALTEPWPISLRHGPDTDNAKSGFKLLLGSAPPDSVNSIYFRSIGFVDSSSFLRFDFSDPEIIEKMVDRFDLKMAPEDATRPPKHYSIRARKDVTSWWPADEVNATDLVYVDQVTYDDLIGKRHGGWGVKRVLSINTSRKRAYFEEHTF